MSVQLEPVWARDDVAGVLRDALELVAELEPPDDLRAHVFNFAGQLLSQRTISQGPVTIPGRLLQ